MDACSCNRCSASTFWNSGILPSWYFISFLIINVANVESWTFCLSAYHNWIKFLVAVEFYICKSRTFYLFSLTNSEPFVFVHTMHRQVENSAGHVSTWCHDCVAALRLEMVTKFSWAPLYKQLSGWILNFVTKLFAPLMNFLFMIWTYPI